MMLWLGIAIGYALAVGIGEVSEWLGHIIVEVS